MLVSSAATAGFVAGILFNESPVETEITYTLMSCCLWSKALKWKRDLSEVFQTQEVAVDSPPPAASWDALEEVSPTTQHCCLAFLACLGVWMVSIS